MLTRRLFLLLLSLCAALSAMSQTQPEMVTVDGYLTLTFPSQTTHFDSLGVTLFQTTLQHTTYQVVKRAHMFERASQDEKMAMIGQAAQLMMNNPKFEGMTKNVTDTVIGGSAGRFVHMIKNGGKHFYDVFLFITIQGTNAYSLQCTSYNPPAKSMVDAQFFYAHASFHRLQAIPVKPTKSPR